MGCYSWVVKTQSAKICLNFIGGGGGLFLDSQNSKWQDLPKFQFSEGGGVFVEQKFCHAMSYCGSPCITDSLSHTTYVE